jgi:CRISPR-associated protein Cas2
MRNVHLISYDICDPKRYRQIYKVMCGHGDPLQYSVFRCDLSAVELQSMKTTLWPLLNLAEDRVMIVDLGPVGGRGEKCIEYWGDPRVTPSEHAATII